MPDLKHEIHLRLRAIELIALWEGRLITTQLTDWFGVSRQQASADINRYITEINPGSLIHSPSVKGYVPADNFSPALTIGLSAEYLALLEDHVGRPAVEVLDKHPSVAIVQHPDRATRPNVSVQPSHLPKLYQMLHAYSVSHAARIKISARLLRVGCLG